jgi:hypothetical protein
MDRVDKAARKAKTRAWRESEHEKARSLYPMPDSRLAEFFEALEELRAEHGCFHDYRHSLRVVSAMSLTEAETDSLLAWCNDHGGCCDCEIAANTFMHWHETRARV